MCPAIAPLPAAFPKFPLAYLVNTAAIEVDENMAEINNVGAGQSEKPAQDLSNLDVGQLTPISPEVISRQATINIGTIGHVAHGKSTVVKALSGVQTVRFKNELERNITIKLEPLQVDVNGEVVMPAVAQKRKYKKDRSPSQISKVAKKNSVYKSEYNVENIVDYQFRYGVHNFLVKWEGWNTDCNTWEPLHHLQRCPSRIDEYLNEKFTNEELIDALCDKLKVNKETHFKNLENALPKGKFANLKSVSDFQLELLAINSTPLYDKQTKKLKNGQDTLRLYFLSLERRRQNAKLAEWEELINNIVKGEAPIKIENEIDLEVPPSTFIYINRYIPMDGVHIPNDPPIGCSCEVCGPKENECCGRLYSNRYPYRDNNKLNVSKGSPIYECNKMCKCSASCRNRVVQSGRTIPLCIFRTDNGRGWGVKTLRKIFIGEFVCEYVGEVITHEEAERRGEIYDAEGRTYLFDLDFNMSDNPYTVDAANYGNISHFINHSCDPNLGVWAVWINCLDPNIPQLALFAVKEIEKGEEITFDYMAGSQLSPKKSPKKEVNVKLTPTKARLDLPDGEKEKVRPLCKCAEKSCRRYLF